MKGNAIALAADALGGKPSPAATALHCLSYRSRKGATIENAIYKDVRGTGGTVTFKHLPIAEPKIKFSVLRRKHGSFESS